MPPGGVSGCSPDCCSPPFMLKPVIAHWLAIRPNLGKIFVLGVLGMAV